MFAYREDGSPGLPWRRAFARARVVRTRPRDGRRVAKRVDAKDRARPRPRFGRGLGSEPVDDRPSTSVTPRGGSSAAQHGDLTALRRPDLVGSPAGGSSQAPDDRRRCRLRTIEAPARRPRALRARSRRARRSARACSRRARALELELGRVTRSSSAAPSRTTRGGRLGADPLGDHQPLQVGRPTHGSPSSSKIMSPTRTPAASAGLSATTSTTSTPRSAPVAARARGGSGAGRRRSRGRRGGRGRRRSARR